MLFRSDRAGVQRLRRLPQVHPSCSTAHNMTRHDTRRDATRHALVRSDTSSGDRGQISLQQLNEAIQKMGAFCAANSLPHLSEDQLRNDLGLGTKHKSTSLFFIDSTWMHPSDIVVVIIIIIREQVQGRHPVPPPAQAHHVAVPLGRLRLRAHPELTRSSQCECHGSRAGYYPKKSKKNI